MTFISCFFSLEALARCTRGNRRGPDTGTSVSLRCKKAVRIQNSKMPTRKVTKRYRNRSSVASVNFRDAVVRFEEWAGREAELG
jgi:hypothetical protein